MEVNYLGHSSFRVKGKTATLVTDPYDAYVGFKFPKTEADVVTISHEHQDHNQKQLVGGNPYVIEGPGEYEIKGVSLLGLQTFHDDSQGEKRGINTVYRVELDGISLCHLGDLGHPLSSSQLGDLDGVDILFIPVGGVYTIGPKKAVEVIGQIQPKMVIPMHFFVPGMNQEVFSELAKVEDFLKEMAEEVTPMAKLVVARDQLPEERKVVVLERKK